MRKGNSFADTVSQIVAYGVDKGIIHLYTEDSRFPDNTFILKGKTVVNFSSCSYLGLEFDPRLKRAAQDAIARYGTQFSASRAYLSLTLYRELETLLMKIFHAYCVVTPTTTLGHISAIPVLVNDEDAVIKDQQVHSSVQTAVELLKPRGIPVEVVRHNRMDLLEARIIALQATHAKVWYMADGIYSMFGDECPVDTIYRLMDRYPALHFYVDDAHGMGIRGEHGRGFVLDGRELHPRMVMATSLNKSFAAGGGLLLFPNPEQAQKVFGCGGPMMSSGPMQPGSLGAAIAAAKIHLSGEIHTLQAQLRERIRFTDKLLRQHQLPVVSQAGAAVFFVGLGLPRLSYRLVEKMLDAGFYLNLGIFPVVPMKQAGVRFTVTRLHRFDQLEDMAVALARSFREVLAEEHYPAGHIYQAFGMQRPDMAADKQAVSPAPRCPLDMAHYHSITEVNQSEWDALFSGKGSFDRNGLYALEQCFSHHARPEDCWQFDYLFIRDPEGRVVLATFLTTTLWKDDMLSPAEVSARVEENRKHDPYYLTSKVISTGSLLTEGGHLYVDRASPHWKAAMQMLLDKMLLLQEQYRATTVVLRDFREADKALDDLFADRGFYRIAMPDTHIVDELSWDGAEGFYQQLSKRSRQHFREDVRKHQERFAVSVHAGAVSEATADSWYRLYLQVKNHHLGLNTFPLPRKLFSVFAGAPGWEALILTLKDNPPGQPVCVVLCYQSGDAYVPLIIGMDYSVNRQYKVYRQALYQLVLRARQLGKKKIFLGFSASVEKRKVGAKPYATHAYMQTSDIYPMQVLGGMPVEPKVPVNKASYRR